MYIHTYVHINEHIFNLKIHVVYVYGFITCICNKTIILIGILNNVVLCILSGLVIVVYDKGISMSLCNKLPIYQICIYATGYIKSGPTHICGSYFVCLLLIPE